MICVPATPSPISALFMEREMIKSSAVKQRYAHEPFALKFNDDLQSAGGIKKVRRLSFMEIYIWHLSYALLVDCQTL